MTKIKTNVCRKHTELSVKATSSVLVEKEHLCNYFPNPLHQNFIIFHIMSHVILLIILQISFIYLFIYSFIYLSIYLFIYLFIHSLSFIY